jgi:hypothetical protein
MWQNRKSFGGKPLAAVLPIYGLFELILRNYETSTFLAKRITSSVASVACRFATDFAKYCRGEVGVVAGAAEQQQITPSSFSRRLNT